MAMMNRRFFNRVDVQANGELLWATKSRFGRVTNHREYITTKNVSIDGAKIAIPGSHNFPEGAHARIKFGIQFCEVEVLETTVMASGAATIARVIFLAPDARFVKEIEKYLPVQTDEREDFLSAWT